MATAADYPYTDVQGTCSATAAKHKAINVDGYGSVPPGEGHLLKHVAGGVLRTWTRPSLDLLLLLRGPV
jgi:hypothetical protein